MNEYILLQKNDLETTQLQLVFDLPEEFTAEHSLNDMMLLNVTIADSLTDKFFQPLYVISKRIREMSFKLINAHILNPEMLKVLDVLSRKLAYLSLIDFSKPYKPKTDDETATLNNKIIQQFAALVRNDTNMHRFTSTKANLKTINLLKDSEINAVEVLSSGRLRIIVDRTYTSRSKLRVANDFFIVAPVWSEFSEVYSIPDRKSLSGIRAMLYFVKDLKVPSTKKKSSLFSTGSYFLDAVSLVQAHIDTFIKILESDCFKLYQPIEENLKEVYDLLASLDLKYSFVLSKMKTLYHFETKDNLKILEQNLYLNTVLSSGSDIAKCICEEIDYQLNSLEQDFAVCRFLAYNFNSVLQLALKLYVDDPYDGRNVDTLKRQWVKQHVQTNCIVLTSALIDIPVNPTLVTFSDVRFPNVTIEGLVSEYFPELLNNPNLANLILNKFIFNVKDFASFKIVKKADEEDASKVYIYLYAFPNKKE